MKFKKSKIYILRMFIVMFKLNLFNGCLINSFEVKFFKKTKALRNKNRKNK